MKTDEFSDAIRRKLDSVSPPFQEKKWMQFQAFMHQAGFPPSVWQSPRQWWQPALSAAAVTGLVVMGVWQYQANQTLTRHVQTLTQNVERLVKGQTSLQRSVQQLSQAPAHPDTVYVVQHTDRAGATTLAYSTVPPHRLPANGLPDRSLPGTFKPDPLTTENATSPSVDRLTQNRPLRGGTSAAIPATQPTTARKQSLATTPRQSQQPEPEVAQLATQPDGSPTSIPSPMIGSPMIGTRPRMSTSQRLANRTTANESVAPDVGRPAPVATRTIPDQRTDQPTSTNSANQPSTPTTTVTTSAYDKTRYINSSGAMAQSRPQSGQPTRSETGGNAATNAGIGSATEAALPASQPERVTTSVQPLAPLGMPLNTEAHEASWASHLRRVRYRSPYAPAPALAAATAPTNRPTPSARQWRIGVGGDVSAGQAGVSANTEVILASRWALSAGVGLTNWQGDAFQTEAQFTNKTRHPFHSEYPTDMQTPVGPGNPLVVIDISRKGQSVVIPLQVSYRFLTTRAIQLSPFVGANLSVNPSETIRFEVDRQVVRPHDDDHQQLTVSRPLSLYSSATIGASAERRWGHLVGQLSPFAAIPLSNYAGALNTASVGLRARVYYQF